MLFLKSEDLFGNVQNEMNKVHKFLNISDYQYTKHKKVWKKGKYNKIDPSTEKILTKQFEADNERLYELIDKKFNWKEKT